MSTEKFRTKRPREAADFLMGIPAVVGILCLVPLLFFILRRESRLEYTYRKDAEAAFENNDEGLAVICFDRLVRLRPNDKDRFQLANWLRQTGQSTRADSIMQGLAPTDKRGFGPAHMWFAKRIMESDEVTTESMTKAISHLKFARDTMREGGETDYLLASCFWATGSINEALLSLRDASIRNPKYYYELFQACQRVRILPAASTAAKLAGDYYKPIIVEQPANREARQKYIETKIWLNEFRIAEASIRQGMRVDPEGEWNKTLAEAYLAEFRQTKSEGLALDKLLTLLEKALEADPESPTALTELTNFAIGSDSKRVNQLLESVLSSGRHTAIVHFVIGSRALQRSEPDRDAGLFHMRRAFDLNNNLVHAANNLAYSELLRENGDIEGGLELINKVLERFPESHAFRETRGQLLTRLSQHEQALSDLEYALTKYPREEMLHSSLAECYRELGRISLAKEHLERLEALQDLRTEKPVGGNEFRVAPMEELNQPNDSDAKSTQKASDTASGK